MNKKSLRVLHVAGSEDDSQLLRRQFERAGYDLQFKRIETPEAMTRRMSVIASPEGYIFSDGEITSTRSGGSAWD